MSEIDTKIAEVTEKQADGRKRIEELKAFDQVFTKQLAKLRKLKIQEDKILAQANEIKVSDSASDVLQEISKQLK